MNLMILKWLLNFLENEILTKRCEIFGLEILVQVTDVAESNFQHIRGVFLKGIFVLRVLFGQAYAKLDNDVYLVCGNAWHVNQQL